MRFVLILALISQLFLVVGCDKGRVIDENERRKVLTKDGNEPSNFGENLQVYPDLMTPQSEYGFVLYNYNVSFFVPVKVHSLLKFEGDAKPQLTITDQTVEMTCKEQTATRVCETWSYAFNVKDIINTAPSMNFEIQMIPSSHYVLSSQNGDTKVHLADYDTYRLMFIWPDARFAYYIARQNFFVNADLVRSTVSFDVNNAFTNLFYTAYYWPSPGYQSSFDHAELISNEELKLEFNGFYKNAKTQSLSKVHYILESL